MRYRLLYHLIYRQVPVSPTWAPGSVPEAREELSTVVNSSPS
ncbi:hypothetical protein [Kitasatospora sp. MMS16-BH015]|nr:hypothetical protein [Kitasatospora sp. MMS16-BH015]